jgi:hypothetical protein
MMRWNSFGRTLLFGVLAALGLVAGSVLCVPPLRWETWLSFYLVATLVVYVVGLGPGLRRGVRAGLLAAGLGAALLVLADGPSQVALGAAAILAISRSGLLYRWRPDRGLVLEGTLVIGGLLLGRFLAGGGLGSIAFGLWGFFLVQSVFFLIGGVTVRTGARGEMDPFERARLRLVELIEENAGERP